MQARGQPYSGLFALGKAIARIVTAAAFALTANAAVAATHCVDTSAELDDALQAFVDDDEDTVVNIAQGTYGIRTTTEQDGSSLTLRGGYTDGTCTQRSFDASSTVLVPAVNDSLYILASRLALGSLTLRGFAGEVELQALDESLDVTRVRFEGPATQGNHLAASRVYVNEVLVQRSGSSSSPGDNRCALRVYGFVAPSDEVVVQHSTIAANPGAGLCVQSVLPGDDDHFPATLENNVFYGNALDLRLNHTSNYRVRNNVYASVSVEHAAADPAQVSGNSTANPLFVNAAANDFRLQNASPAINSGRTTTYLGVPQYDIAGNPRYVGPAPDRGAYESAIDGTEEIVVTNTGDDDTPGTLRWALGRANANANYSVIRFDIPGSCPRPIVLGAELPGVTTPVGIDGYSQPGSHPNTLDGGLSGMATDAQICVWITSSGTNYGLRVPPGSNGRLGVSGLTLGNFQQAAIAIEAGTGSSIVGNEIRAPEPIGIFVGGTATGTQIGGPDPWQTNVIRSRIGYGVALNPPSTGSRVENNLIGIEAGGNEVVSGNAIGIGVSASGNTIVGNAIAGSTSMGVHIIGDRNAVRGNVLGRKVGGGLCLPPNCSFDLANGSHGVLFQGVATGNGVESNTIANSGGHGICATGGQRNFFLANRIWNSGALGIDLGDDGADVGDNDAAPGAGNRPNRGINSPVLVSARGGVRSGRALGGLLTTNGRYLLQAYASNGCAHGGQAQWLVGTAVVDIANAPAGGNGSAVFNVPLVSRNPTPALTGRTITVSVSEISAAGYGQSSELSGCETYVDDTIFANGFQ